MASHRQATVAAFGPAGTGGMGHGENGREEEDGGFVHMQFFWE